jgi:hypothetical protein
VVVIQREYSVCCAVISVDAFCSTLSAVRVWNDIYTFNERNILLLCLFKLISQTSL